MFSKYIDQFSFALLNVGTVFFISKFLVPGQAVKYVLVSSLSSFSLVVVVAVIISPFWIFSADDKKKHENFIFSFRATFFISIICGIVLGGFYFLYYGSCISALLVLLLSITYPIYDFLRRSLYVNNGEFMAAINSALLCILVSFSYLTLVIFNVNEFEFYIVILIFFVSTCNLVMYKFNIKLLDRINVADVGKIYYRSKANDYWLLGKWSAGSMICFWMATQGLFILLSGHISDEQLVTTRLCLSVTGIMAIYFSALENKLMPTLRKQFVSKQYKSIWDTRKSYYIRGVTISSIMSVLIAFVYSLVFANGVLVFLILCIYQIISGVFKFESYLLKILQKHKIVFLSNLLALVVTLLFGYVLGVRNENVLALMILINGLSCSIFYVFFSRSFLTFFR